MRESRSNGATILLLLCLWVVLTLIVYVKHAHVSDKTDRISKQIMT
jgi:hypothetical protein